MPRALPAVVLTLTTLCATAVLAQKNDVTIAARDGFPLKASLYTPARSAPGVLLLHQCNADRQIYDTLGTMLRAAGYTVLALDFRGFRGSKNAQFNDLASSRDKMPDDVDAALAFLSSRDSVNKTALGVVGGSCGVNQAIQAARRYPEVRTLVLLSGGTDDGGEAFVRVSKNVPIFGAASEEDTSAAASIRKILGLSVNPDSQLSMFKNAGHAASMFDKEPDLEADIVLWFRKHLPVAGYGVVPSQR
jgi:dienelactone hydrolase